MANVFIAPKIKVGFQKRSDTFTGQLAYIIYYDEKGKLRKEQSWQSWRDKKIAPQEFDNTPLDGFTLNKDVQRSREWFGSGRNMIRIHDPRGFEFEVTCENLIEILMHTDCLRRGLVGQFVYAWVGPELVLLPTNSEEYQNSLKYTAGLSKKVSAKNLVPGISYKTKREGDVVYMGRLNWYEYSRKTGSKYSDNTGTRQETKVHVFTADEGKTFMKKGGADFLSEANSDQPVANFAELMQKFNRKPYANKIVKIEFRPTTFDDTLKKSQYDYYGPKLARDIYFVQTSTPDVFAEKHVSVELERETLPDNKYNFKVKGYDISDDYYRRQGLRQPTGELVDFPEPQRDRYSYGYSYYNNNNRKALTIEQMQQQPLFDLVVTFENGKERKVNSLYQFTQEEY